jgi:hypothetical protein
MSEPKDPSTRRATSVEEAKRELQASREALMHQMVPSTRARRTSSASQPKASSGAVEARLSGAGKQVPPPSPPARARLANDKALSVHVDHAAAIPRRITRSRSQVSSTFGIVRHAFNAWWQFHPARAMGAIAEPFIEEFAERRPFRLLAISMVAGAAIAVVRPWRLISVGGIALAALKSSRVSSAALNFMADKARRT